MTYWRMQLHPSDSSRALMYSVKSLCAGYIGLDFDDDCDIGDLMETLQEDLPDGQRDCWGFAHEMAEGDPVLIIAHHFPLALAIVKGPYNYIRQSVPELGVWFTHFREVKAVRYYADFVTDVRKWQQFTMTDTISPLRDKQSQSYQLIETWLERPIQFSLSTQCWTPKAMASGVSSVSF